MEIVKSRKGHDKIALNGYLYRKDKTSLTRISWRCDRKTCKARLATPVLYQNVVGTIDDVVEKGEHVHAPDPAAVEVAHVKDAMLAAATATNDPPRRILQDNIGGISQEAAARIASGTNLKKAVSRKRRRDEEHPPQPQNPEGMQVPPNLSRTFGGQDFLLHDSGVGDESRLLLFGTMDTLSWMEHRQHWFGDGTFKVVPELFFQLYTIHVHIQDAAVPCVYALMQNKTEREYDRLWTALKELNPRLNPQSFLTDFEVAARNSARRAFPDVQIAGCFFHLCQSIWRRVQHEGLRATYVENENFRGFIKMMTSVAFLPPDQVLEGFQELQSDPDYIPQLDPIFDFFEDNYLGRPLCRGQRRESRFGIPTWNAYTRLEDGVPRTNNAIEGWHAAFHGTIQCSHPTVWRFIQALRREEALQRARYAGLIAGEAQPRKQRYITLNKRIATIIGDRENRTIKDYLRGISHNISLDP